MLGVIASEPPLIIPQEFITKDEKVQSVTSINSPQAFLFHSEHACADAQIHWTNSPALIRLD